MSRVYFIGRLGLHWRLRLSGVLSSKSISRTCWQWNTMKGRGFYGYNSHNPSGSLKRLAHLYIPTFCHLHHLLLLTLPSNSYINFSYHSNTHFVQSCHLLAAIVSLYITQLIPMCVHTSSRHVYTAGSSGQLHCPIWPAMSASTDIIIGKIPSLLHSVKCIQWNIRHHYVTGGQVNLELKDPSDWLNVQYSIRLLKSPSGLNDYLYCMGWGCSWTLQVRILISIQIQNTIYW